MNTNNNTSTIMVLEPDAVVRAAISEFLRDCGYLVIEGVSADDLHAALEADAVIDVVLAEVTLKGSTTGFELAHGLRQTQPEIAVILVSSIENVVEKAGDLCGRNPVRKPYHHEEILRRIRMLVERRDRLARDAAAKE
ncbi:MAG: response regulator [Pseudomonadota bacterium]